MRTDRHRRGRARASRVLLWLTAAVATWGSCVPHTGSVLIQPAAVEPVEHVTCVPADFEGAIEQVVLQANEGQLDDVIPAYRDLMRTLALDVSVTVVCDTDETVNRLRNRLKHLTGFRVRPVTLLSVNREITVWARDRMIAARTGPEVTLLVPEVWATGETERQNDAEAIPEAVQQAATPPVTVRTFPLGIEGGNLLASRTHLLVGRNAVHENVHPTLMTPEHVVEALRAAFGKPVIVVGETFEDNLPAEHLDMYMTVVADDTVIVGRRVVLAARNPSPRTARPLLVSGDGNDQAAETEEEAETAKDPDPCDLVAAEMAGRGFRVLRIPIHPDPGGEHFVTFNNALLEERAGRRIAYVPRYGMPDLEHEARLVYARAGYEVRFVDVRRIYALEGAVRCLANVLKRGGEGPASGSH